MDQKNFAPRSSALIINEAMGFTYPKAHFGKKIFVDFFAWDPATETMRRHKKHFDRFTSKREMKKAISHYIAVMSEKLRRGFNPNVNSGNKGLTTINCIFEKYESTISHHSRIKTQQNYKSRLTILKE